MLVEFDVGGFDPAGDDDGADYQVQVVGDDTPEDCQKKGESGRVDDVAIVFREEPFAESGATGGGTDHQHYPQYKFPGEDHPLVRIGSRKESEKQGIDHKIAGEP